MSWPMYKLKNIAQEFISGGTPSTQVEEYWKGTIPWITGADVTDRIVTAGRKFITEEAVANSATHIVPRGSVLLVTRTGVGKIAKAGADIAISQDLTGIVLKPEADSDYVILAIQNKIQGLQAIQQGSTIKGILRRDAENIDIPLPPLPEQRRIVEILDQADALRKLRREADQLAERILPALFYKMFGDPVRNEKGWETKRIESLCNLVRGSSPRPKADPRFYGGPVPRLLVSDLTRDGLFVDPITDSLTEEGAKMSRPMKKGEVVMAVSGAVGLPAILKRDACIHDGFVGFRDLSREVNPTYLVAWLNILRSFNASQAVGAIWQNLNTHQINNWQLPLPPESLQDKFAESIVELEILKANREQSSNNLDKLFASLLHRAFTGELTKGWRERQLT